MCTIINQMRWSTVSKNAVCTSPGTDNFYVSPSTAPAVGQSLYTNAACTTPVPNGWYINYNVDPITVYVVTGGAGLITSQETCGDLTPTPTTTPTPTPIIYIYYFSGCCSPLFQLEVTSNTDLFVGPGNSYYLEIPSLNFTGCTTAEASLPGPYSLHTWNIGTDTINGTYLDCGDCIAFNPSAACPVTPTPTTTSTTTPTPTPTIPCGRLGNTSFEEFATCGGPCVGNDCLPPTTFRQYPQECIPYWQTTAPNSDIEIWKSGYNGVPSYVGTYFAEINASSDDPQALFQNFTANISQEYQLQFAHRGREFFLNTMRVGLSGVTSGVVYFPGVYTGSTTAWSFNTVNFVAAETEYNLIFSATSSEAGGNFLDAINIVCSAEFAPTPTPTATPTNTPSDTPTSTPTETPTNTPTFTPTNTTTPSVTPTNTATPTQTETPDAPTQTPTPTSSETPTPTPTNTETPTNTPSNTQTPTPTGTNAPAASQSPTPTPTETPTNTPTQTLTPSPTGTLEPFDIYSFRSCCQDSNIFRYVNVPGSLIVGQIFYISGPDFDGCAEVLPYEATGEIYSSDGTSFTQQETCNDGLCPPCPSQTPTPTPTPTGTITPLFENALLTSCADGEIFYAIVQIDVAFVGATYVYNNECYTFVEFSGPGGPNLGAPDYGGCDFCVLTPTPTPTPSITPTSTVTPTVTTTQTPTPSSTPIPCDYNTFCFSTILPSLSGYSGTYTTGSTYNSRLYYTGNTSPTAYIYYTGSYWCLSTSLGGTCLLEGKNPCYSACPDISANYFSPGACPAPTPTPIDCDTLDFQAFFDCDFVPFVTPTPSIPCDLVDMRVTGFPVSPTPTPSSNACIVGLDFSMVSFSPATPSPTPTLSLTPTKTVPVEGQITYTFFEETFDCPTTKVLIDCNSQIEFYTTDALEFAGTPINIGVSFAAYIGGELFCLIYDRNDDNLSSNTTIESIFGAYGSCETCNGIATPTPTVTPTITPSPSVTPTLTPTPTSTPQTLVYVFASCALNAQGGNQTTIVQTSPVGFAITPGQSFKDSAGNCWSYVGSFTNYYPEYITILVNFSGNYFNLTPTVYANCLQCTTAPINQGLTSEGGEPLSLCITYDVLPWTQNLPDSCGGYTRGQNRVIVQLRNSITNALVQATNNVVVTFTLDRSDCLGNQTESLIVTVPQGQVQGQSIFDATNCEACPTSNLPETVTKTVTGIQTITPSSISECQ